MEIKLLLENGSYHYVSDEEIKTFKDAYVGVDVIANLKKMQMWCVANPTKRKTKRGINKFIVNWLNKQPAQKPVAYAAAHKPFKADDKPKQITPETGKSAFAEIRQAMRGRR